MLATAQMARGMTIFEYSASRSRRHGPRGYAHYQQYKPWLRDECIFRCVFCLIRETWEPNGELVFTIDHLVPQSLDPSAVCEYSNFVYCCRACNQYKGPAVVNDSFQHSLRDHCVVRDNGEVDALTTEGRRLIDIFRFNTPVRVSGRRKIIELANLLRAHGSVMAQSVLRQWFGFPHDLPDLRRLRPRGGNTRPAGLEQSYYVLRERGMLPDTY